MNCWLVVGIVIIGASPAADSDVTDFGMAPVALALVVLVTLASFASSLASSASAAAFCISQSASRGAFCPGRGAVTSPPVARSTYMPLVARTVLFFVVRLL